MQVLRRFREVRGGRQGPGVAGHRAGRFHGGGRHALRSLLARLTFPLSSCVVAGAPARQAGKEARCLRRSGWRAGMVGSGARCGQLARRLVLRSPSHPAARDAPRAKRGLIAVALHAASAGVSGGVAGHALAGGGEAVALPALEAAGAVGRAAAAPRVLRILLVLHAPAGQGRHDCRGWMVRFRSSPGSAVEHPRGATWPRWREFSGGPGWL